MSPGLRVGLVAAIIAILAMALLYRPAPASGSTVVVYTSVDSEYAEKLAERFTLATGIKVQLSTDSELTKTTGMLEQIRALKDHPVGDVFWNSELSGTLQLAREGLFETYRSPSSNSIPGQFKDADGKWTGFGLRARVLIFNTGKVKKEAAPKSLEELARPEWRGRFCIPRALFGTTRSHLVSLVLALGPEKGFALLRQLRDSGSDSGKKEWLVDGNSAVRDLVSKGAYDLGITDTDDVYEALDRHSPVDFLLLDQTREWPGVYVIPNSVSILKGAVHLDAAKVFVDFLLKPETEAWLAQQGARQIPVRTDVPVPAGQPKLNELHTAEVNLKELSEQLEPLSERIDKVLRGVEP